MRKYIISLLSLSIINIFAEPTIREEFEVAYAELKASMKEHSYLSDYSVLPEYKAIINMGSEITPYIMEKFTSDKDGFHLTTAIEYITKKTFAYDADRKKLCRDGGATALAKIYVTWWDEERDQTPILFNEYYKEWIEYKQKGDQDNASLALLMIEALGIDILPLLYETDNLPADFLPIICRLTNNDVMPFLDKAWKKYWEDINKDFVLSGSENTSTNTPAN